MSQAFTKEGDASDDLPERPISDRPNYVTPAGLAALRQWGDALIKKREALLARRVADTEPERKSVERDLRYVEARLASAMVIDPSKADPTTVRFGAIVSVQAGEEVREWAIVGEDEADPAQGKVSWCSPLALALMGAKAGDRVAGPDGGSLVVRSIRY